MQRIPNRFACIGWPFSSVGRKIALNTTNLIGERGEPVVSGNRSNHFALMVDDLAVWEKHLQTVGADFRPRKQRPDGAWQVFVRDPDGHAIELFTPPA